MARIIVIVRTKIALSALVLSFLLFAAPAVAKGQPSPFPTPRASGLSNIALRACQARENAVKNRMESLTNLATNIEKVFDSIATRVENFYAGSGKTVSNYNTLVGNITTSKGTVDTDLASAQSMVNSFSCTSGDPRSLLNQFRLDMQKVKTDLKNYRTSIKNLIVAVRPLAPEATESPEPTPTP